MSKSNISASFTVTFITFALLYAAISAQELNVFERINTYEVELPIKLSGMSYNLRTWAYQQISTRLATGMDSEKNIYIGCSSESHDGYVFKVGPSNRSVIVSEHKFPSYHVLGLYVHPDGSYGALIWNPTLYNMTVVKVDKDNNEVWRTELRVKDVDTNNFDVGDARFEYGNGEYRAYYHVHGVSSIVKDHMGDAYVTISETGQARTIWDWGCSHSMSNLLRFQPDTNEFLSVCDSDAYPGLGVYTENRNLIYNAPGNMRGSTAAELGGAATGINGTWLIVFNAPQPERGGDTYDKNAGDQDIVLAFIGKDKKRASVKYLTNTPGVNEDDSCIARLGKNSLRYLVGWKAGNEYYLGVIDSEGEYAVDPVNVANTTKWGNRDDSFRTFEGDGSVFWLYAPNSRGNKILISTFTMPDEGAASMFSPLSLIKLILMLF